MNPAAAEEKEQGPPEASIHDPKPPAKKEPAKKRPPRKRASAKKKAPAKPAEVEEEEEDDGRLKVELPEKPEPSTSPAQNAALEKLARSKGIKAPSLISLPGAEPEPPAGVKLLFSHEGWGLADSGGIYHGSEEVARWGESTKELTWNRLAYGTRNRKECLQLLKECGFIPLSMSADDSPFERMNDEPRPPMGVWGWKTPNLVIWLEENAFPEFQLRYGVLTDDAAERQLMPVYQKDLGPNVPASVHPTAMRAWRDQLVKNVMKWPGDTNTVRSFRAHGKGGTRVMKESEIDYDSVLAKL